MKMKRVIADDSKTARFLIRQYLEMVGLHGTEFLEAENGKEAVEAFDREALDFIWMDMRMPVMDGYAATKAIRDLPGGEQVKILAVTTSVFEEQRDGILGAGCDEIVSKPLRENKVFAAIGRLLAVEYQYAETLQPNVFEVSPELTVEMLSELPPEWISDLRKATRVLSRTAMAELIERIEVHAPDTAKGLQRLVDDFQFERIRDLLGEM